MTPTAEEVKRAVEMLKVSARRSSIAAPSVTVRYDEAECDGYCVADDCEAAAEDLDSIVSSLRAENAALELSVAEAGGAFELCDRENERLRAEVERLKAHLAWLIDNGDKYGTMADAIRAMEKPE